MPLTVVLGLPQILQPTSGDKRVEFFVVPFVDKDGVEDGDQGKNRRPHDHNRDYGGRADGDHSIYASTRALRERIPAWSGGKLRVALDLHCPWIRGEHNEVIYFVGGYEKNDGHSHGEGMGQPAGGMGAPMTSDAGSHMATDRETVEGVAKADGGQTVAEIFINAGQLKDQTVKVRGRVVKFSPNIMGTNWIHIQDGTGSEGTHDLTVTTGASGKVGDVVLVEGPLSVDRDFGAGYRYAVIVEGATVTVE